jgi:hypothetical protein
MSIFGDHYLQHRVNYSCPALSATFLPLVQVFSMMTAQSCLVQGSYSEAPNYPRGHTQFRYFNLSASTSSLESASPSSSSQYTTTSSSTNPGLGSATGKGILAFGKMAQRGFDGIVIRRRLAAMKSIFPHKDDSETSIEKLDSIYDDVLELSRCAPSFHTCGISFS